jgi:ribosomal protein L7/L12
VEVLKCPSCGSPDLDRVSLTEYRCAYCGTRVLLAQAPTAFVDVVLTQTGSKQISVIKALREATDLSLAAAKRATDAPPVIVARSVPLAKGEAIKSELERAGATAELKPV